MIELKPKRPKQNQHHSKQGYKCYQNTDIHTTGTNAKKERKPFKKNAYFVKKNVELITVKGTKP